MSGTNTIPGGYMTSFYKKDGSSSHRRHQGPSMESIASSEFIWHFMKFLNWFSRLICTYSDFHFYFRLCNMAVWSESDKFLCQQEFARSAASPSSTDCPRENRLVCQIWPPLVCLCGETDVLQERSALQRMLSSPKSSLSFIIKISTCIWNSNNFVLSLYVCVHIYMYVNEH